MATIGGKYMRATAPAVSGGRLNITNINNLTDALDIEILARIRSSNTGISQFARAGIIIRTAGSDNFNNIRFAADEGILRVWSGTSGSPLQTFTIASLDRATWNWIRVRQDGLRIRARAWGITVDEPTTWSYDAEVATFSSQLRHGLFFPSGSTLVGEPNQFHDCDFVSWGRNGENAPNPE